jgi:predicted amidohydrolase
MNALANAEEPGGPTEQWLLQLAHEHDCALTGSIAVRTGDNVYNRMLFASPAGVQHYDKRHLFRMAGEHERYADGKQRLIVELNGWRICPQVCYDLRFPVWLRNRHDPGIGRFDYDLILFVANWPAPRRTAWSTLLQARAIENLSYCIGVNRVGEDGNGIAYAGDSAAIDFLGKPLALLGAQEQIVTVSLDPAALSAFRQRFPAWMDADAFSLTR